MSKTSMIAGVGPGLGLALVKRFADGGYHVAALARDEDRLTSLLSDNGLAERATAYQCDVAKQDDVESAVQRIVEEHGVPTATIFNAGAWTLGTVDKLSVEDVETCWRVTALGAFLVSKASAQAMLDADETGSILFTGATAALRGSANMSAFAMAKFAQRALSQSLARELGPKGIHVAHAIIDGGIGENESMAGSDADTQDSSLSPNEIAESYFQIHRQHRSAWTQEFDLRPWVETF